MRAPLVIFLFAASLGLAAAEPDLRGITFDGLPEDRGVVTPFAATLANELDDPAAVRLREEFQAQVAHWPELDGGDPGVVIGHALCLAALADLSRSPLEAEIPVVLLALLKQRCEESELVAVLSRYARDRDTIPTVSEAKPFGFAADEAQVRERAGIYAIKFLGRVLGRLPH